MKGSIFASVITAFGASLCCTGPIVLSILGATSLSAFSFLAPIRPYVTILALGILGFAYIQVYRKNREEGCCELDKENIMKKDKKQKRTLWAITPIVLILLLIPYFTEILHGDKPLKSDQQGVVSEWTIEGMTCQGCAVGLEKGMSEVNGVISCQVNYDTKSMVCTYDDKVLTSEKVVEHVAKMGYKAIPKEKQEDKSTSF